MQDDFFDLNERLDKVEAEKRRSGSLQSGRNLADEFFIATNKQQSTTFYANPTSPYLHNNGSTNPHLHESVYSLVGGFQINDGEDQFPNDRYPRIWQLRN